MALGCLSGANAKRYGRQWNIIVELSQLRYFLAVCEASSLTKAAAQLRIAQPALSRRVKALETEIGVDLLRRSARGATLTAEGRLYVEEVREILKRVHEAVHRVRAMTRGEYGELHVGYQPCSTVEILPTGLAAFRQAVRHTTVLLHDLSTNELIVDPEDSRLPR